MKISPTTRRFIEYETGVHDREIAKRKRKKTTAVVCLDDQLQFEERVVADLDRQQFEKKADEIVKQEWVRKYQIFYERAGSLDTHNYSLHVCSKADLLVECFPGRFEKDGKQPLYDSDGNLLYSPAKLGYIFKRVIRTAKKVLGL